MIEGVHLGANRRMAVEKRRHHGLDVRCLDLDVEHGPLPYQRTDRIEGGDQIAREQAMRGHIGRRK